MAFDFKKHWWIILIGVLVLFNMKTPTSTQVVVDRATLSDCNALRASSWSDAPCVGVCELITQEIYNCEQQSASPGNIDSDEIGRYAFVASNEECSSSQDILDDWACFYGRICYDRNNNCNAVDGMKICDTSKGYYENKDVCELGLGDCPEKWVTSPSECCKVACNEQAGKVCVETIDECGLSKPCYDKNSNCQLVQLTGTTTCDTSKGYYGTRTECDGKCTSDGDYYYQLSGSFITDWIVKVPSTILPRIGKTCCSGLTKFHDSEKDWSLLSVVSLKAYMCEEAASYCKFTKYFSFGQDFIKDECTTGLLFALIIFTTLMPLITGMFRR